MTEGAVEYQAAIAPGAKGSFRVRSGVASPPKLPPLSPLLSSPPLAPPFSLSATSPAARGLPLLICRPGAPAPISTTFSLFASMAVSLRGSSYVCGATVAVVATSLLGLLAAVNPDS
jgi:hypothetical protein